MNTQNYDPKYKNLKVWVKFAEELFKKCFGKTKIKFTGRDTKGYAAALESALMEYEAKYKTGLGTLSSSFIRDKVAEVYDAKADGDVSVPFNVGTLAILLNFAGLEAELILLKNWQYAYFPGKEGLEILTQLPSAQPLPESLAVLYTPKAFRTYSIMRSISSGRLTKIDNGWEYHDAEFRFSGRIESMQLFTMPGDAGPFWIKITYHFNNTQHTAYIAEGHSIPQTSLTKESDLLRFLSSFS